MDMDEVMTPLSQIHRSPFQLVSAAAGLVLATPMSPGERTTDEDPPEWEKRDERWTIDGLLGCYNAGKREITIFSKGIEFAAPHIGTTPELLTIIVRLHEWGHAVFHLGVDQETSAALANAYVNNRIAQIEDTQRALTQAYQAAESYVHEQIAQVATRVALDDLLGKASVDQAKIACTEMIRAFEALMRRQPEQYRLDRLSQIGIDRLRSRLRGFIRLSRTGALRAEQQVWDTVMAW
jgi:hypothetical protein